MRKKQPVYKGLDKISVLYNDQSEYSPEIFDITDYPSRLTAGKNILRFRGNLANLAQNSPLDIEIIDYNGEPIYHEITTYIAEDKSRVVSIYIYPDTSPGPATITLLTEVQSINGQVVPENWKNVYNAKWSRTVYVNPTLVNESEIIFETLPTVDIEEQVGVQLDRTYQVGQYVTYDSGSVKYVSLNNSPALILTGGAFSSSMKGGTVTINNPINPLPNPVYNFTAVPYTTTIKKVLNTSSVLLDTEYSIASTHSIFPHTYTSFENSSYSLSYDQSPSYIQTQNSESYAIIKINNLEPLTGDISRIKTYINNAGTVGTWEQISDIELEETEIFVVSTASIAPDKSIGFIESQTTINNYFTSASIYDGKNLLGISTIAYNTTKLNNSMYVVSSGSIPNAEYDLDLVELVNFWGFSPPPWWPGDWPPYVAPEYINSTNTSVSVLRIKDAYKGTFLKNSNYKVTLDAVGVGSAAKLSVYASGSAFNINTTDRFNRELPITVGKKIGELDVSKLGNRIDDHVLSFTADNNGTGVLIFILEKGNWYISDIRTTSDNDAGYTPNYTRIRALVPTSHKSDVQLNFKIEYYNAAGFKCKQDNYVNNVPWAGGNRYIDGDYSMLTGSLYVADSLNSGIAISGYKNSGFVRSLGYNGFAAGSPGFLLWSGSAMSGSAGTKGGVPYSGVGLELYANSNNYFRYSTTNSELDIRTNTIFIGNNTTFISSSNGNIRISGSNVNINTPNFFLGTQGSTFISGSNGNLQISASNFSVDSLGNVTASNMHLNNVAYADGFVNNCIVITNSNKNLYYENYQIDGLQITGSSTGYSRNFTKLLLDGSKGGEAAQQVRIEYQPDWPIGMVVPPGYVPDSPLGYTVSIENFALNNAGNFGGVYLANAVASSSLNLSVNGSGINTGASGPDIRIFDFGLNADVWDFNATAFDSVLLGSGSIRGITDGTLTMYGQNTSNQQNCWNSSGTIQRGMLHVLSYGGAAILRRTTNGTIPGSGYLPDSYWDIIYEDDTKFTEKYFGAAKFGNRGMIIGGVGSAGSRTSAVHQDRPHGSAILQLNHGSSDAPMAAGSSSVFIPPRISTTRRDYIGDPVNGSIIYNSTTDKLQVYAAGSWVDLH